MLLGPSEIQLAPAGIWGYGQVLGYPVSGSVSSPFGPRAPIWTPAGWTSDWHSGIDIPAPKGTPVYCPAPGVVSASFKDLSGGQTVVVRFDDSTGAMFVHMEGLQLPQGMKVRRGDIIGTVGTSGLSTGDHLHFSLLHAVADGPMWYDRSVFMDPLSPIKGEWIATIPNSEVLPVEDIVGAKAYAEKIRAYIDQGVPLPALATMLDTLIGML